MDNSPAIRGLPLAAAIGESEGLAREGKEKFQRFYNYDWVGLTKARTKVRVFKSARFRIALFRAGRSDVDKSDSTPRA